MTAHWFQVMGEFAVMFFGLEWLLGSISRCSFLIYTRHLLLKRKKKKEKKKSIKFPEKITNVRLCLGNYFRGIQRDGFALLKAAPRACVTLV